MGDIPFTRRPTHQTPPLPDRITLNVVPNRYRNSDWSIQNENAHQVANFNFNLNKHHKKSNMVSLRRDTKFPRADTRLWADNKMDLFYRVVDKIVASCPHCLFFRGKVNKTHHGKCISCGEEAGNREFKFQIISDNKIVKAITRKRT